MIELITGLPGNGKTLYTIGQVKAQAERENRPVFYHGIAELTLNWELLQDPKDWAKVPPNSIVVIDEAQKTFRNRSLGTTPASFVTDLETHRHLGIDLVMITQHPSLIDPAVRRLAGRHQHMVRVWGMQASMVHRWDAVKDNCDKSRADSQKTRWAFDKRLYGVYKSAEVHTMKRSIPTRVKMLLCAPFLLAAAGYYVYHSIAPKKAPTASNSFADGSPARSAPGGSAQWAGGSQGKAPFDPVADAKNYVQMNTPRVVGLPQTAPKYDALTVPVRVPVPAMCVQIGKVSLSQSKPVTCKCYSQQGTPMPVQFNMCIDFARNGYFQDFDAEKDKAVKQPVDNRVPGSQQAGVAPGEVPSRAAVVAMADIPEPAKAAPAKLQWGH